ncbi:MAG: hypothetical protein V4510_12895 [bacterium]
MSFPVNSTSIETRSITRAMRVLQRGKVGKVIASAGVYICKLVVGSDTPSQHSYGNAADLFPRSAAATPDFKGTVQDELRFIARECVRNATKRTWANRGVKLKLSQVIDHDARRIWEPGRGWFAYTGTTGPHIHISGDPMYSGPCGPRP